MIKLYDEDSYINEFWASVTSCEKREDGYAVCLDSTAFFPTAGGQDCDTGTIDGKNVLRVEIENDTIFHIMETPIETGKKVFGKIDWDARLRKMQHHSAEHIVSGIAHTVLGAENVGFHLSEKEVTIDYDKVLTPEDVLKLELLANEAVRKNIEITAVYPPEEELLNINYRSKLDLSENVRIVTIDGIDVCACCAPHVKSTGEIGVIKLKDLMHHRGGVRLKMICAGDALSDYQGKAENALRISNLLSAKQEEIADSVERLLGEMSDLKQKNAVLSKALASLKADAIQECTGNICVFDDSLDADALRHLANEGKKKCNIFAVLSGNNKSGYSYIIASEKVNLRDFAKDANKELSGRGGGREDMIQGFFGAGKAEIERFFAK